MAKSILIIGKSGSGKSASLRNLDTKEYALINVLGKQLPFQTDKAFLESFNYSEIRDKLVAYSQKTKTIVIDDAGYLLTNALMNIGSKDAFKHYRDMANDFWELLRMISKDLPDDVLVYLLMHEETDELGNVKVKTAGKMLDNHVTVEGMFTIVLRALKNADGHRFQTSDNIGTIVKSPMGMFESQYIDNDLKLVNDTIKKYYNIGGNTNE